jgi:NAD(P)-dependent dehydrogenase (short-subunit alcohol dehydrogenase family)
MRFSKFDLTGKVALITGSAGLLGLEHGSALLESGATVILTDISEMALYSARDRLAQQFRTDRIVTSVMDVSRSDTILSAARTLATEGYRVDILVNNAAIDPKVKGDRVEMEMSRLENFSLKQWELEIAVGLTGAFLCSQVERAV